MLTLLAWHGMGQADCVVYDALVGDDVLKLAKPGGLDRLNVEACKERCV